LLTAYLLQQSGVGNSTSVYLTAIIVGYHPLGHCVAFYALRWFGDFTTSDDRYDAGWSSQKVLTKSFDCLHSNSSQPS